MILLFCLELKTKIAANINHAFGSLGTYLDYCSVKKENGAILVEHKSFNAWAVSDLILIFLYAYFIIQNKTKVFRCYTKT